MDSPALDPFDPSEVTLRLYRQSMFVMLCIFVAIGAIVLASALWPGGLLSRWLVQAPWLIPVVTAILVAVQQTSMRRHRLSPDAPEFKAILRDEWRRASMTRASRGALVTVLAAQLPLALLFLDLPASRAVWAMAGLTITLGMAAQVGLFLFFDRK